MSNQQQVAQIMESVLGKLKWQSEQAEAALSWAGTLGIVSLFTNGIPPTGSQGAALRKNLEDAKKNVQRLKTDYYPWVLAGDMSLDSWLSKAQLYSDQIQGIRIDAQESGVSLERIWGEIVVPTYNDTKEKVATLSSDAFPYLIAAGVLFIVVVAVRVS